MKVKMLLVTVLALIALVGTAQAGWYMSYGQAKSETKRFAKEFCAEDSECTAWGVGPCYRRAQGRFTCMMASFYRSFFELGDKVECDTALHWGAGSGGYIRLKNYGKPDCYQVA